MALRCEIVVAHDGWSGAVGDLSCPVLGVGGELAVRSARWPAQCQLIVDRAMTTMAALITLLIDSHRWK